MSIDIKALRELASRYSFQGEKETADDFNQILEAIPILCDSIYTLESKVRKRDSAIKHLRDTLKTVVDRSDDALTMTCGYENRGTPKG